MLVASLLAVAAAANKSSKRPKELVELGRRKGREPDRTGLIIDAWSSMGGGFFIMVRVAGWMMLQVCIPCGVEADSGLFLKVEIEE